MTTTQPTTRPTVAQSACCQLAPRSEDVLRALGAGPGGATVPELAHRLRLPAAVVSGALDPLVAHGLVAPPGDGRAVPTPHGRQHARHLVRRHALVELLLVRVLDLGPREAPAEADLLEHAVSPRLLTRIDALLGGPVRDLRGELIPGPEEWP